jgi:hypothetical protein
MREAALHPIQDGFPFLQGQPLAIEGLDGPGDVTLHIESLAFNLRGCNGPTPGGARVRCGATP